MTQTIHLEVGARGTSNFLQLKRYTQNILLWGCDADTESIKDQHHYDHIIPYALSSSSGHKTLYITEKESCSSFYQPNYQWLKDYSWLNRAHNVLEKASIKTQTIDNYLSLIPHKLSGLSIDTQGSELDILRGASQSMSETLFIQTEAQLLPQYLNASRLDSILTFLLNKDFILYDLQRIWIKSDASRGYGSPRGCLWYLELTFFRSPAYVCNLINSQDCEIAISTISNYLAYCEIIGASDVALDLQQLLLTTNSDVYEDSRSLFTKFKWKTPFSLNFRGQGICQKLVYLLESLLVRTRFNSWFVDRPVNRSRFLGLPY